MYTHTCLYACQHKNTHIWSYVCMHECTHTHTHTTHTPYTHIHVPQKRVSWWNWWAPWSSSPQLCGRDLVRAETGRRHQFLWTPPFPTAPGWCTGCTAAARFPPIALDWRCSESIRPHQIKRVDTKPIQVLSITSTLRLALLFLPFTTA